jgi:hypothetical protein
VKVVLLEDKDDRPTALSAPASLIQLMLAAAALGPAASDASSLNSVLCCSNPAAFIMPHMAAMLPLCVLRHT